MYITPTFIRNDFFCNLHDMNSFKLIFCDKDVDKLENDIVEKFFARKQKLNNNIVERIKLMHTYFIANWSVYAFATTNFSAHTYFERKKNVLLDQRLDLIMWSLNHVNA